MGKDLAIHLFHGFLGLPSDWQRWRDVLSEWGWQTVAANLFSFAENDEASLTSFCDAYVETYLQSPAVLFGYSMGGRLALELAKRYPHKVQALILASTQLVSPQQIGQRQFWEQQWSERFINDDWHAVCGDWEAQEVFAATSVFRRVEADYNRQALARAIKSWSVTKQDWSDDNFPQHSLLWMLGEADLRMQPSAKLLSELSQEAEIFIQPNAGHRFIYELPEQTFAAVEDRLSRLGKP